jgi:hypothetical protein
VRLHRLEQGLRRSPRARIAADFTQLAFLLGDRGDSRIDPPAMLTLSSFGPAAIH